MHSVTMVCQSAAVARLISNTLPRSPHYIERQEHSSQGGHPSWRYFVDKSKWTRVARTMFTMVGHICFELDLLAPSTIYLFKPLYY